MSATVPGSLSGRSSDRAFYLFTAVVSAVALGVIAWLLLFHAGSENGWDLRFMPAVNAGLNTCAAALLLAGWFAVRAKAFRVHKFLMVSAFLASSLFLVGYLAYHYAHGDTRYAGTGALRVVYLSILASHVILSMFVVPMALLAFYFAARRAFDRHKKVTRFLFPIWMYVSVTGVVIYFMLRGSA